MVLYTIELNISQDNFCLIQNVLLSEFCKIAIFKSSMKNHLTNINLVSSKTYLS